MKRDNVCARCGSKLVEVAYGLPSSELFEAAKRGELVVGGCIPEEKSLDCPRCGQEWLHESTT